MIRVATLAIVTLCLSFSVSLAQTPPAAKAPSAAKAAPANAPSAAKTAAASTGFHGAWTMNKEKIKDMPEYKAAPEAQQKMMLAMLQQITMVVTFGADSMTTTMEMGGQKKEETAKYTVKSASGNTTVITTTSKDGKTEDMTLTLAGDELVMAKGVKQKLFLKRHK